MAKEESHDQQRSDLALRGQERRNQNEREEIDRCKYSDDRPLAGVHRPRAARACLSDELLRQQHYWASSAYSAVPRACARAMHMFRWQSSTRAAGSAGNWTEIALLGAVAIRLA